MITKYYFEQKNEVEDMVKKKETGKKVVSNVASFLMENTLAGAILSLGADAASDLGFEAQVEALKEAMVNDILKKVKLTIDVDKLDIETLLKYIVEIISNMKGVKNVETVNKNTIKIIFADDNKDYYLLNVKMKDNDEPIVDNKSKGNSSKFKPGASKKVVNNAK